MLLFRNSPFSVICNLVGLVGERPLRACMLYLSLSCVRALMRRALAASREAMRFSCGTKRVSAGVEGCWAQGGAGGPCWEGGLPGAVAAYREEEQGEGWGRRPGGHHL